MFVKHFIAEPLMKSKRQSMVEKIKQKLSVERIVLVVSLAFNGIQMISDEAQEWVAMSRNPEPQKKIVEQVERPDSLIAKQVSSKK